MSDHNTIPFVPADMPNGCETGACSLARIFYQSQRRLLWRLKHRGELSAFYHATYDSWAREHDLTGRSFAQVLYALVNDGRILRINKGRFLVWTDPDCPDNKTNRPKTNRNHPKKRHHDDHHRDHHHDHHHAAVVHAHNARAAAVVAKKST